MAKGFFSQGAVVLMSRTATLDELEELLRDFSVPKRDEKGAEPDLSGPSLTVTFRPAVNGYVSVDVQARPWPDHMGDPGSLQRASEQWWSWDGGSSIPASHRAFVRIRLSYVFGAEESSRVMPEDCDPVAELAFVNRIGRALLEHPAALALFNPSGEVLCDRALMDERIKSAHRLELPAIDLWSSIRLFNLGDGWMMMDSVGMLQVDLPDVEACFPRDDYEPHEVDDFLRNLRAYAVTNRETIKQGETLFGPGDVRWRAMLVDDGLVTPPRPVVRWFPLDGSKPPAALVP